VILNQRLFKKHAIIAPHYGHKIPIIHIQHLFQALNIN